MRKEDKEAGITPGDPERKAKLDKNPKGYGDARDRADDGNTAQNGKTDQTRGTAGYEERN
jgi:hypothetical protein